MKGAMSKRTRTLTRTGSRTGRLRPGASGPQSAEESAVFEAPNAAGASNGPDAPNAADASNGPDAESRDGDLSSISGQFFDADVATLRPFTNTDTWFDEDPEASLPPHVVARRTALRRIVSLIVACASIVVVVVGARGFFGKRARPMALLSAYEGVSPASAPVATALVPRADGAPFSSAEHKPLAIASAPEASAPGREAGDAEAPSAVPVAAKPPAVSAEVLRKETLSLLNRGKTKGAIDVASQAIAADPSDAMAYLYLGTALQELGRSRDAREAYSDCVRHASHGPVAECRQLGGHK